jgi:vesicle transport protein SEC22|tara:strand:- start:1829 stop:2485 length:657 start_codon:yes stop_codon:yes gene_type:complete
MVKLTMLARVADGLPLAEGLESDRQADLETYKQQAKSLFKKLGTGPPPPSRMSYESGPYFLHYMIEGGVCYLTLTDRGYPKKLAYQYLEDLQKEFTNQHGHDSIETVARPYAFIKFDTFIQKTKKLYQDTRTQRNLTKLNEDLHDIQNVMSRNINDILGQGERLDHVSSMSETLRNESRKYSSRAKDLSRQALIQKYAPIAVVIGFVLLLLIGRHWLF